MKNPGAKKEKMDWYFPRVHGKIALPQVRFRDDKSASLFMKKNMQARHTGRFMALLVALSVMSAGSAPAAESRLVSGGPKAKAPAAAVKKAEKIYPKEAKKAEKTVSGTVVSVRKYNISVELAQTEENGAEEMLIPVGDELKLANVKSLKELAYGDLVEVKFLQVYLPSKKAGGDPSVLGTKALEVKLVERAADRAAVAPALGTPA